MIRKSAGSRAAAGVAAALALASVEGAAAQAAAGYPVEEFLGMTTYSAVVVSPDGRHVAFVASRDDFQTDQTETAIWRVDVGADGRLSAPVRLLQLQGPHGGLAWSPDSEMLSFTSGGAPPRPPQLFVLDAEGGEPKMVTDPVQLRAPVGSYAWSSDGREIVFVAAVPPSPEEMQQRAAKYGDVHRQVSVAAPRSTFYRVAVGGSAPQKAQAIATVPQLVIQLALSPDGEQLAYGVGSPNGIPLGAEDHEIFLVPTDASAPPRRLTDNLVMEMGIQWDRAAGALYFRGIGEPDATRSVRTQSALYRVDPSGGRLERLASGFEGEIGSPLLEQSGGGFLLEGTVSTSNQILHLDAASGQIRALTSYTGRINHLSASKGAETIAFVRMGPESFPEIYVARGVEGLSRPVAATSMNGTLSRLPAPELETIRWTNHQGETVEGILFWPPGRRGAKNLPLVVSIHGGPWLSSYQALAGYETFAFAYYPALLASRGYLVLDPNYRGSTGRGNRFVRGLEGRPCSAPVDDILSGVDVLVQNGWADRERMGVMGYSFGGVATNCLITRTRRFKAAASGAGVFNKTTAFGVSVLQHQTHHRFGGKAPWEDIDTYWRESPISQAGNLATPTIISVGGADPLTPPAFSQELYRALTRNGVPSELLIFPGQSHQFSRPAHKRIKVNAELDWFERHLRGRSAPTDR